MTAINNQQSTKRTGLLEVPVPDFSQKMDWNSNMKSKLKAAGSNPRFCIGKMKKF
jgi:hypothetical protein